MLGIFNELDGPCAYRFLTLPSTALAWYPLPKSGAVS
ncbi:Uncharacterised protein [Vibrio cholerae]|nr:Uncharacterised protein [Vibrio cholerae]